MHTPPEIDRALRSAAPHELLDVIRVHLADRFQATAVDLLMAAQIPGLVTAAILGMDDEADRALVVECANDIFAIDAPDGQERHIRGQQRLAELVVRMLEYKRAHPATT